MLHEHRGFTLIELLLALAILATLLLGITALTSAILRVTDDARMRTRAVALANERVEIIRNLPYTDVGTTTGIPRGKITPTETLVLDVASFVVTTTIRNIDDPFDGTIGGTPNDTAPADYKSVEVRVTCPLCRAMQPVILSTLIAPKNLETTTGNGALLIRVFDTLGNPVQEANVHIENTKVTPNLMIDEVTNLRGEALLVDVPPSVGGYHITVSKPGYSTDATFPPGQSDNPNPVQTDSTVEREQLTQASFSIDRVSTLRIRTATNRCGAVSSVALTLTGAKQKGTNPDIPKFTTTATTDATGMVVFDALEADTYTIAVTDDRYTHAGSVPSNPIELLPNGTRDLTIVVERASPRSLLVSVTDTATTLPLSGVSVALTNNNKTTTHETGRGFVAQTDWSGGSGQELFDAPSQYWFDDSSIDASPVGGDVTLKKRSGTYASAGSLISSTIDFGAQPNYVSIRLIPIDQPLETGTMSVRLQIATNNDRSTWNFVGPDGTANSYFTPTQIDIPDSHDGQRYFRYHLFLSTDDPSATPNVSEIQIVFVSQCVPPGQVYFGSLAATSYDLLVTKEGYNPSEDTLSVSGTEMREVLLAP